MHRETSKDWANSLVLPTRFSVSTAVAIESGVLTKAARVEVVDSLATLMLTFTSRPTPHDFDVICRRLTAKYPKLKDLVDGGYVSFKV